MGALSVYFNQLFNGMNSIKKGMHLTWRHLWASRKQRNKHNVREAGYFSSNEGIFTAEYPSQQVEIPERGRYQLHNVMEDCIVCDKCVKVCPVDCIEIDPIKATGLVGYASDGSPIRLYAAKFDIDMSKCCFCGLCTTVCPTECLTMTSEYDFSTFDVKDHLFHYSNLTPEEAEEKRRLYEQFVAEKEEAKLVESEKLKVEKAASASSVTIEAKSEGLEIQGASSEAVGEKKAFKPAFKPSFKKPSTDKPKDE